MVEVGAYLALWSWVGIMVADSEKKRIDASYSLLYILILILCMVRNVPNVHAMPAPYSCVHVLVQSRGHHLCSITLINSIERLIDIGEIVLLPYAYELYAV